MLPALPQLQCLAPDLTKLLSLFSLEMEETDLYQEKTYGRLVKEDDVQDLMTRKVNAMGTWKIRRLAGPNTFFMACPSREVIHHLMAQGQLKGNGFQI